jgi:hypothetical protein
MKIQLGGKKGGHAIVSKKDYADLSKYKWHKRADNDYVSGWINGKHISMHRYIMSATKDQVVDHINHVRWDNRRSNLRITTVAKNGQNKTISPDKTSSKFKGVYYNKNTKRFFARINIDNKVISLGTHNSELEAAEAFDLYVVHNDLDHISLNFPEKEKKVSEEGIYTTKICT